MAHSFRSVALAISLLASSSLSFADVGLETDTAGYSVSGGGSFTRVAGYSIDFTADGVEYVAAVAPSVGTNFGVLQTTATTTPTVLSYTFSAPTNNPDLLVLRLASLDDGSGGFPNDLFTLTTYDQFNNISFQRNYTTSSFLSDASASTGVPGLYPDSGWLGFELGAGTSSFTITLANAETGDFSPTLFVDYYDSPTPVPEAGSTAMVLAGMGLMGLFLRRRQNKQQA